MGQAARREARPDEEFEDGNGNGNGNGSTRKRRLSWRPSWRRRRRPELSHAFAAGVSGEVAELVDLNAASEELLMTLPGVDRRTARAIVDHRRAIGRFRRIEDAALVPGMGAERLAKIRAEVKVRRGSSANSPRDHPPQLPLDVNAATAFQLQRICGFDQKTAAAIVERRRRKGDYATVDSLLRAKGVDRAKLGGVRSRLVALPSSQRASEDLQNIINGVDERYKLNSLRTLSCNGLRAEDNNNGSAMCKLAGNVANDVFDLLSAYSSRPFVDPFDYTRNGRRAIRLATWNLREFGVDKANNPGVREVICRTVLENRLSIIALQDVRDEEALKIICEDLNAPSLKRIIEWKNNSKKWKYRVINRTDCGKGVAFLYEASNGKVCVEIDDDVDATLRSVENENLNFNYAFLNFIVNRTEINILNVQFRHSNLDYSKTLLCDTVDKLSATNKNMIIVGDFYSLDHVKDLATCYESVISPDVNIQVEVNGKTSPGDCGSAILVAGDEDGQYAGKSSIIRSGLCHLAIPYGWAWGGPISPYCPLWAEFYVND